jgi:hypothetical protein
MSSVYTGALIAESLRPAAAIEGFPLTVTKIYRAKLGHADAGQAGRARAAEHGRSLGVPEAQLDWPG